MLISFSSVIYAQNRLLDSLNNLLGSGIPDTTRVHVLIEVAGAYLDSVPDFSFIKCSQAFSLSTKIKYENGISESAGWLAYLHEQKGNIDSALFFYQKSLSIAQKTGNKKNESIVLNNMAAIYKDLGKIKEALDCHTKSLSIRIKLGDKEGIATSYNNLGLLYLNQGKVSEALEFYFKALNISEEFKDKSGVATELGNIAALYKDQQEYDKAFEYYKRCLAIQQETGDKYSIGYSLNGIGNLFEATNQHDSALVYYDRSLKIREEINDKQGQAYSLKNIGLIFIKSGNYSDAEKFLQNSLVLFKEVEDKWGTAMVGNLLGKVLLEKSNYKEAEFFLNESLRLAKELGYPLEISNAAENLVALYRRKNRWKEALDMNDLFVQMRDSVQNDKNRKSSVKSQFKYEYEKKEAILKSEQEKKEAIAQAEIAKQKLVRNGFIGGFAVVLLFAGIFFRQRNRIQKEKQRSEELLLNILPEEVAEELKNKGSADAKQFDEVTVMFTDFKGFTQISEKLSPQELVGEIDSCFKAFDNIISKHNIEKIKTIGDSYMCAGGLPVANKSHAEDLVRAALEIQHFMQKHLSERKKSGKEIFEIRIGIHTGPVVAGIVGVKKFAYDIWGDTVNTASRMESSGEAGKVNISESTYELVKDKFTCTHRGKISAKNKGEIDMYFVELPN